jgi:UDP:flavonoid glycosyltransferase YjiC (YdhE family)
MLDGPRAEIFAVLADALEAVIGDERHRRSARRIADAIDALPPVDAAVDVLLAVARGAPRFGQSAPGTSNGA